MPRLILRRMLVYIAALLAAAGMIFVLLEVLPGDPARILLGLEAGPEQIARLRMEWGLDKPAPERFFAWIAGLMQGEWGQSYAYGVPVSNLILERLSLTAPLAFLALILTLTLAFAAGIASARHPGGRIDALVMVGAQAGLAIPGFWLGQMLVIFFAVILGWLPAGGFPGWGDPFAALRALLLPAVALAAFQAAVLARVVRAALLEVLGEDYVRTARAKGLPPDDALWRHALPNAFIPILAIIGLQAGNLLTGAIVIEQVFTLPGLGRLLFQAITNRDLVLIKSCALMMAALVLFLNFVTDLLYRWIDPRLGERHG